MIPFVLILVSALFVKGVINKTRARLAGRTGVRFFQPLLTLGVLLGKGEIYSTSATVLTRVAPAIYLASAVAASLMLPLGVFPAAISFDGDFIVFSYLLAFGKLALVLAALESGSSFQGMGSAREVLFSMLVEPCFFLLIGTLAMVTGYGSFSAIFAKFDNMSVNLLMLSLILAYGFLNVALVENGTWAPSAGRCMRELLEGMKGIELRMETVLIPSTVKPETEQELDRLADWMTCSCQ